MEIENGIRPVCDALNSISGVRTLWSCEGHPNIPLRPYVAFECTQDFAFSVHKLLDAGHASAKLKYSWRITASFKDNGHLQYLIEPNDTRIRKRFWLIRNWKQAVMNEELLRLAELLKRLG